MNINMVLLSPQMRRRVFKEIKRDDLNAELIDNDLYILLDLNETLIKKLGIKDEGLFLKLNLNNYPFNPPEIKYIFKNKEEKIDKIYFKSIISSHGKFEKELKKISGVPCCLGCSSFICRENWAPTKGIKNIVDEFINILEIKSRVVERLYCDKIQEQLVYSKTKTHINYLSSDTIRIADYL
jgi:hypothetical protein